MPLSITRLATLAIPDTLSDALPLPRPHHRRSPRPRRPPRSPPQHRPDDAPFAALVAHPHPPCGGTMHNKVVYHAMKAFTHFGLPVLRFNFRGTGLSEGTHDDGRGEVEDVRAALDWLAHDFANRSSSPASPSAPTSASAPAAATPASTASSASASPSAPRAATTPTTSSPPAPQPKLFISGDHDEFCPPDVLGTFLVRAPEPKASSSIAGADHFFQGIPASPKPKLDQMQQALRDWLRETFSLSEPE